MKLTKSKIKKAFVRFDKGDRPKNYQAPHEWYVLNNMCVAYPLKTIASLATDVPPRDFNTNDAKSEFNNLDFGIVSIPSEQLQKRRGLLADDKFGDAISKSLRNRASRKMRLKNTNKQPTKRHRLTHFFDRDPDVVAEILERANGKCEKCKNAAPFKRKTGKLKGEPYLEVHHKKQLSKGGHDTVPNAIALCPNCHRKAHYG